MPCLFPGGSAPVPASIRQTVPAAVPSSVIERTLRFEGAGEGIVRFQITAPGCDWGTAGAESAVATVTTDGQRAAEVVVFNGQQPLEYTLMLGPVTPGNRRVTITFRPDLSPRGSRGIMVTGIKGEVVTPRNPAYIALAHAPILLGRDDNATTDTPLLAFYEMQTTPDKRTHLRYSVIWSNEDGGTGNDLGSLVARWGRSTDIEQIYDLTLGPDNKPESETIQAENHEILPFRGRYQGMHPILRTATSNNMVSDAGESPFRFAFAPLRRWQPDREPREAVMDSAPWTFAITAAEMQREKKWEVPADPATLAASDIRNYLHVDYQAEVAGGALLAAKVRLKDGRVFVSDHNRRSDAIGRSGWVRTTIELPPDTTDQAIDDLAFLRRDTEEGATAQLRAVRAFRLEEGFRPRRPFRQWRGMLNIPLSR